MANWWQKTLVAAAAVTGAAVGAYTLATRRPLPQRKGTLHLKGLHEPVEIITDRYGVPHIYAQNEDDLYFAQGYVHAQERLWQMELNRRTGSGRLAELFGPIALEADRFNRRLGLHRSAAAEIPRLSAYHRRVLEAYAQGVNTFIERNASRLPIEFTLLRFQPAPWRAADSIQWAKMVAWSLSGNWETEVIRARLVAKLGPERAARVEAGYDPGHPLIIPSGASYAGANLGLLEQYEYVKQLSGFGLLGGSNNWVVDGTMTETGAPMLCNDPHLGQAAPSIWYECHLIAGDIDVIGASFPGAPGITIGHNQHIAWGLTNAVSDVQDLYIEKFNPHNPLQYDYQGRWEDVQVVREEIAVKGQKEPQIEEVYITRHGPILSKLAHPVTNNGTAPMNDTVNGVAELPLALRWVGLEQCTIISAILKLNRATNWDEFRDALRDWDIPPQNVVYGDNAGNIGYIMAGAIPVRAKGQALLPSPGWTGEYEWTGYIPFDELPQAYNPPQHYIVTANNRVVDDSYPHYITHEWLNGYRAQRIRDLLTSAPKLTKEDMARIQADYYALPAVELVPHMLSTVPGTALERAALGILRSWDYMLTRDSVGAALYMTFLRKLEGIAFDVVLGDDPQLMQSYFGVGSNIIAPTNGYASRARPLLIRLLKQRDDGWFADSVIPNGPKSWDEALAAALRATVEELQERLGNDISGWRYGRIHTMTYNHPLGTIKPLNLLFNRGPFPLGGDVDTVNMGAAAFNAPETVITVPSFRQIVDLGRPERSLWGHAPGQSGHPASQHYDDLIPLWLRVDHHPMLFTRDEVEAAAEGTLHLTPE